MAVVPQLVRELAVANVDRVDANGPALEQAVGEAAGRGAHIERDQAIDVDAEDVERVLQLLAAATDVPMRPDELHDGIPRHARGLPHVRFAVNEHIAGQDGRLRLFAAFGQSSADHEHV